MKDATKELIVSDLKAAYGVMGVVQNMQSDETHKEAIHCIRRDLLRLAWLINHDLPLDLLVQREGGAVIIGDEAEEALFLVAHPLEKI
ncbi:hypothetical protein K7W03_23430 [Sphingobium sp. PNB]|uniref:hypothetical protein n=1 Tax=Sphingobium sp. PNB TaxID=863934 RepID=UPI001CA43204|nr:hypothetical protein [Sphingobium sp. PNB]MCB4862547.1 hypothetical protein [Sphingobium sp. PNB]